MKKANPNPRILFVDNLRIFLISLVVLHHLAITYGGPGSWFYNESQAEFPEILFYGIFLATNQAFFMGMFFFISAYFLVPSLVKKGLSKFAKDRLVRLGIPLLIFFFILCPITIFIRDRFIFGRTESFWVYLIQDPEWGFGPMWFVEALLLFTFGFVLYKLFSSPQKSTPKDGSFPRFWVILLFASIIGFAQFVIRIWLPVGWSMNFTAFQLPHFLQYISLFIFGIVAYKENWIFKISSKMGWAWFSFVQALILVVFPVIFIMGGMLEDGIELFMGGNHWQALAYALWEQLVGFGMVIALLGIFQSKVNQQGSLAKKLSSSAYSVFVFHTPLLVLISAIFLNFEIVQIWKFIVLAPVALIVCFAMGYLIKRLPGARKIF